MVNAINSRDDLDYEEVFPDDTRSENEYQISQIESWCDSVARDLRSLIWEIEIIKKHAKEIKLS